MEPNPSIQGKNTADLSLAEKLSLRKEIFDEFKKKFSGIMPVPKMISERKSKSHAEFSLQPSKSEVLTQKSTSHKRQIPKDRKSLTDLGREFILTSPRDIKKTNKLLQQMLETYYRHCPSIQTEEIQTENKKEDAENELKGCPLSAAETFRKKLEESETVFPLLRVIIIGRLNFTDDMEENIKSLFEDSVNRINEEKPFAIPWTRPQEEKDAIFGGWILLSGYLICYGRFFIQHIEGPEFFLKIHMEDLLKEIRSPVPKLKNVKLLQTSEMYIKRSFPEWTYFIIKCPNKPCNIEMKEGIDGCLSLMEECRLKIYVSAAVVRKYMEDSLPKEDIEGHLRMTVPNSFMLKTLFRMKILPSLDYYVDTYQHHGPMILAEECTWTKFDDKNVYNMIEEVTDEEECKEIRALFTTAFASTS